MYNTLIDTRGDPSSRRVLDDYCMDRGWRPARLGVAIQIAADDAAVAADDAAADAADVFVRKQLTSLLTREIDETV